MIGDPSGLSPRSSWRCSLRCAGFPRRSTSWRLAPKPISRRRPAVARRRAPAGACLRLEGQSALGAIPHPEQHIHLRRFLDAGRGVERALPGAARRAAGDNRALRPVASSAIRRLRSHSVRFPAAVADDFDARHVPGAGCNVRAPGPARRAGHDRPLRSEYRDYAARTPPFSPAWPPTGRLLNDAIIL